MVVELALPATLPGALVALHYAVQMLRPRLGYGSDVSGRRARPGSSAAWRSLCTGGLLAALATAWMTTNQWAGIALAVAGLPADRRRRRRLRHLAARAAGQARRRRAARRRGDHRLADDDRRLRRHRRRRRQPARPVLAGAAGRGRRRRRRLRVRPDPARGLGRRARQPCRPPARRKAPRRRSCEALAQVWAEPQARRFTIFVFVSMLAYSAQDLILEPFAGLVFGMTPGESTKLVGRAAWRRAAGHDRRGAGRQLRPRPPRLAAQPGPSAAASPRP